MSNKPTTSINIRDLDPVTIAKIDELAQTSGLSRTEFLRCKFNKIANDVQPTLKQIIITKKLVVIRDRSLLSRSNIHPSVISFSRNPPTNGSDWQGETAPSK